MKMKISRSHNSFLYAVIIILAFPLTAIAEDIPESINFGKSEKYGKFITARELSIWGSSRNLSLLRDCSFQQLDDFEAEVIPVHGMNFTLAAPGTGRVYLYLDLVSFLPSRQYDISSNDNYCFSEKETGIFKNDALYLQGMRWLEILVNGRSLKTIYAGNGVFPASPVVIAIDRENAYRRTLNITLKPSPGDTFFGIWDAFAVQKRLVNTEESAF